MSDLRSGVKLQTQEILHLPGFSDIFFFKKPHNWTEKLRIGYRKGNSVDHCGKETLQQTSQFQDGRPLNPVTPSVAQHCPVLIFPLQQLLS